MLCSRAQGKVGQRPGELGDFMRGRAQGSEATARCSVIKSEGHPPTSIVYLDGSTTWPG